MKKLSLILAFCLSGCGGSESAKVIPPPVVEPVKVDAYFTAVSGIVGDATETIAEPADIASTTLTEPDDTEPVTL
jgi:hypothetical protein